jgi:uncharacterized membrane-anchored protein YjiN (DUF445 family)
MRRVATGLFVAAAVLFVGSHFMDGFWWGLSEAIAEAAMVGALADWFAVTALFRHPMGIPIWHTAIIPNNKARIGASLAGFIREHFLSEAEVRRQVEKVDFAETIGAWLTDPRQQKAVSDRLMESLTGAAQALTSDTSREWIETNLPRTLQALDVETVTRPFLEELEDVDRMQEFVGHLLDHVHQQLERRQAAIDGLGSQFISGRIAQAFGFGVGSVVVGRIEAMSEDPRHPDRRQLVVGLLQEVRRRLRSEDGFDDLTEYRDLIAEDESLQVLVSTLLERTGRYLQDQRRNGSHLRRRVEDAAEEASRHLLRNDDLRRQVNERIRDHIVAITTSQSQQAAALIEEKVQGWGDEDIVEHLELNVGRDLQFIRINGTLVGGLIGGIIYLVTSFLG